jgi:hypothetical protein
MAFSVVLDAGAFDEEFYKCKSECAANQYLSLLQPLCKYQLEIKPSDQIRKIEEGMVIEEICVDIRIEKLDEEKE